MSLELAAEDAAPVVAEAEMEEWVRWLGPDAGGPLVLLGQFMEAIKEEGGDGEAQAIVDIGEMVGRILELASDDACRDFPVCLECLNGELEEQTAELMRLRKENEYFQGVLENFEESIPEVPQSKERITEDKELEYIAVNQIKMAEEENLRMLVNFEALDRDEKEFEDIQGLFWHMFRELDLQIAEAVQKRNAVYAKEKYFREEKEVLKSTNVLDDCFYIHYDGHFGTINGFRLGRLPSTPVRWEEINAALGQVILLLDAIAKLTNFEFSNYILQPKGSFSSIVRKSDLAMYELYNSKRTNRNFDNAMTCFLECIKEIGEYADRTDYKDRKILIFEIRGDSIGHGYSIKYNSNQEENWTKALKYMLLNLKSLLIWVASKQH